MRYKQHTVSKLEAQAMKLKTLQRAIKNNDMTGQQAIDFLELVIKEISFVVERLELEPNE
jgi:hypothetical protein